MLAVAGSLQVSSIIPLQTDRKRNKINSRLKSILFFFSSLLTTSCMQPYHKREPKCFPLLLSLNVWGLRIVRASVKLDTKRSGIVMWKPSILWTARFLMWFWSTVMWFTDLESANSGWKDCNSCEEKSSKACMNPSNDRNEMEESFITMDSYKLLVIRP
jgi:hypothetical protein